MPNGDGFNDPWCHALYQATGCLREQNPELSDACLAYLDVLENKLIALSTGEEDGWASIPQTLPPDWDAFITTYYQDPAFAVSEALSEYRIDGVDDAGDFPTLGRMDCRRLLIRILTSQSEVYSMKASQLVQEQKDWNGGAARYQQAVQKIHEGLDVADTAISKWWTMVESADGASTGTSAHQKDLLVEDANIVAVSLESMTVRRDKLMSLAKREEAYLLRKLKPHYESRDEVKQRMGAERWKNNPNPKHDYSQLRVEFEEQLKAVQEAMKCLQQFDPTVALQKAMTLRKQLADGIRTESFGAEGEGTTKTADEQRYNGQRPSWEWEAKRVSKDQYPDPTDFGWTFTGSWEAAEFFERTFPEGLVKLDWYFTTATVKTSLDHPTQGKTQLFSKKCNPDLYGKILEKPRIHTGKRYQRNRNRNRNGSRRVREENV